MAYRLSRKARADIKSIVRYTDLTHGPAQTEEYLAGLFHLFNLLSNHPELGSKWSGERRRHVYREHIVYYRVTGDGPIITQIRHSAMRQPKR